MCKEDGREGQSRDPATEREILRRFRLTVWDEFLELVAPIAADRGRRIGLSGRELQEFCERCVIRAYQTAGRFDEKRSREAWIAGVCYRVAGERLKSLQRSAPVAFGLDFEPAVQDGPLDRLLRHELLGWLEKRIADADPVTRRIVELRIFANLKWVSIAEKIRDMASLTAEGTKCRFHRFTAQLRQELGGGDQNG
ncbi:MAG: hypothetical protein U0638_12660 [Phycisphaerales bacterium]